MVWNGTEILVWNMEDARMEWNGMEDFKNGMKDNLPYQFHTKFHALHLQKNICMGGRDK